MNLPVEFFRDEVRDGFYIPTALKQAWAVQLEMLDTIDRVCKKHGIKYFADCGTLIGCVRHGGFVPWDDDLDIGMCRDDYRKFRAVADEELPKEYLIHDYERQENHWLFLARIVNKERCCFDPEYLNSHHNFPWLAGIDIFLKDHLYDDLTKEKERDDEVLHIMVVADGIVAGELSDEVKEHWLSEFEETYGVKIDRSLDARHIGIELYRLAEQQMSRLSGRDSHTMGQIFPLIMKGHKELPDYFYERVINLPFENADIPVTAGYHAFLLSDYHDYLSIYKQGGAHQYPFFEAQKRELLSHADFEYPEYTYDPSTRVRRDSSEAYSASLKGLAGECLERFDELYSLVCRTDVNDEDKLEALMESQQLAMDLGNMTEAVKGEESQTAVNVVASLQAYCDAVYSVYVSITGGKESGGDAAQCADSMGNDTVHSTASIADEVALCTDIDLKSYNPEKLGKCLTELKNAVERNIIKRREAVFLATGPKYWNAFKDHYDRECDEDTDVFVLDLPVRFKDCFGMIKDPEDGSEADLSDADSSVAYTSGGDASERYPSDLPLVPWEQFDCTLHFPDRIYIQDAYDGENPCLSIPKGFYSSVIRDRCSELILVPALTPDEFSADGIKEIHNMGTYVTAPGVVYADRVILKAKWLKERYLEKLCSWAGEETREYWDSKIEVISEEFPTDCNDAADPEHGKRILYMIGLDGLVLQEEKFIDRLSDKLKSFADAPDVESVSMCLYPPDLKEWKRAAETLSEKVWIITEEFEKNKKFRIIKHSDIVTADHDCYYGSAAPAVLQFRLAGKEVTLLDYLD